MQFIFTKTTSFVDRMIRLAEGGEWSHVACVLPTSQMAIEAKGISGVKLVKMDEIFHFSEDYAILQFEVPDPIAAFEYANTRVGKGYDFFAIPGLLFKKNWGMSDRDYCSELSLNCALAAGAPIPEGRYRMGVKRLWDTVLNEWGGQVVLDTRFDDDF